MRNEEDKIPVLIEIDGLIDTNIKLFLRKYQKNLAMGYRSNDYSDQYDKENFVVL